MAEEGKKEGGKEGEASDATEEVAADEGKKEGNGKESEEPVVREVFLVQVGGTRCVTSGTDTTVNIHHFEC